MSLFIMESVNFFGKKPVQVVKCIVAASPEFAESQSKIFLEILQILNYNKSPSFHWLSNWAELTN